MGERPLLKWNRRAKTEALSQSTANGEHQISTSGLEVVVQVQDFLRTLYEYLGDGPMRKRRRAQAGAVEEYVRHRDDPKSSANATQLEMGTLYWHRAQVGPGELVLVTECNTLLPLRTSLQLGLCAQRRVAPHRVTFLLGS